MNKYCTLGIVFTAGLIIFSFVSCAQTFTASQSVNTENSKPARVESRKETTDASRETSRGAGSSNGKAVRKGEETVLSDYQYGGADQNEALVYRANEEWSKGGTRSGFMVPAVKIYGSFEQGEKKKVFARVYEEAYRLFGNQLEFESGSDIPVAITFVKGANGIYQMEKYKIPEDGSHYEKSIRAFCTQPVSGEQIPGLADQMLNAQDMEGIVRQQHRNLADHLVKNGIDDAVLHDPYGQVLFSLKDNLF